MGTCPACGFENAEGTYFCGRCQLYLRPLGPYQLVRAVGKGGFASVFEARHQETGAIAAVKILHREFLDRDDIQQRFAREAQVMKELDHPFVVQLYDYGELTEAAQGIYLVMEWCDGQTLQQALTSSPHGRFPPLVARRFLEQLLEGLQHIHAKGIVHRDLKPGNLMLVKGPDGTSQIKILDFGLAWIDGKALTRSDMVIGSLLFMAPEQIRGRKDLYGPATDLYAAGVLLAWMLTGTHIFGDVTREQIMVHHVLEAPPSLSEMCPEIRWSPSLEALVARALCKEPEDRFGSAAEMLDALAEVAWPDFARADTMPVAAFSQEAASLDMASPGLSPYDDTGALEAPDASRFITSTKGYQELLASSEEVGQHAPGDLAQTEPSQEAVQGLPQDQGDRAPQTDAEISLAELEGTTRPTRKQGRPGKPLLWLVLFGLLGVGAWGVWPAGQGPGPKVPAGAGDAGQARAVPEARSAALPSLKYGALNPGKEVPPLIAKLLQTWRDAWQATAEKPFQMERLTELKALYHPDFRDVSSQRDRDAAVAAMAQRGQNSSWMRINISDVYVHSQDADKVVLQFRQKCFGSTMRARTGDLTGSTFKEEGLRMLEWKQHNGRWQIWRSIWQPLSEDDSRDAAPGQRR